MKSLDFLTFTFLFSIFLSLSQCSVTAQVNLITKTCKKTLSYQLCRSTLQSGLRSFQTNIKGLCLIVTNASLTKSTAFLNNIDAFIKNNSKLQGGLNKCKEVFKPIGKVHIPKAFEALKKNDTKVAKEAMNKVVAGANECVKSLIRKAHTISSERWDQLKIGANSLYNLFLVNLSIIKQMFRQFTSEVL